MQPTCLDNACSPSLFLSHTFTSFLGRRSSTRERGTGGRSSPAQSLPAGMTTAAGTSAPVNTQQAIQLQQYRQKLQQMHQQLTIGQQQLKELQKKPQENQAKVCSNLSLSARNNTGLLLTCPVADRSADSAVADGRGSIPEAAPDGNPAAATADPDAAAAAAASATGAKPGTIPATACE